MKQAADERKARERVAENAEQEGEALRVFAERHHRGPQIS